MAHTRITCLIFIGLITGLAGAPAGDGGKTWRSASFLDRVDGTLADGGANTYVAADGSIRLIHLNDLNNDGHLDLVAPTDHSQSDGRVDLSIFWGKTKLSPQTVTRLPSDRGKATAVADLNGDGFADLVLANANSDPWCPIDSGQVSFIYWGAAAGFSAGNRLELPAQNAYGVTVADLDADGSPEVIFANIGNTISADHLRQSYIYWGDRGRYGVAGRTSVKTERATDVKAVDLNQDGWLDLIFTQEGNLPGEGGLVIYWGGAGGRGAFGHNSSRIKGDSAVGLAIGDLNADGFAEIVIANEYRSKGREANGIYTIDNDVQLDSFIYWGAREGYAAERRTALPTLKATGVAIGDLNRDGRPDLVFSNSSGGIGYGSYASTTMHGAGQAYVYWNGPEGFARHRRQALPTSYGMAVAIADINRDGWADVALANQMGSGGMDQDSYIYWGGPGGLSVDRRAELPTYGASGVQVADLDGDAMPDLVFANSYANSVPGNRNSQRIYWGDGTGLFSDRRMQMFPISQGYIGAGSYSILDLNTDGYVDLSFSGPTPQVLWGGPDGLDPKRSSPVSTRYCFYSTYADFNRDGYLDLVCAEFFPGSTVSRVYFGSPTGFASASHFAFEVNGPRAISAADLNKDGWLEVIFSTATDRDGMAVFWGGAEGFDNRRVTRLPTGMSPATRVADLNKDGWLDIVAANLYDPHSAPPPGLKMHGFGGSPDGKALVYWGGPGGFDAQRRLALPGIGLEDVTVADYNRDGWLDFAASHYSGSPDRQHPSYVYWNGPQGFAADHVTMLPTFAASGAMSADFNNDGYPDVRFANHVIMSDHSASRNFIYFGGKDGFDPKDPARRTEVYNPGPHLLSGTDIGNVYDRSDRYDYISPPFDAGAESRFGALTWEAETPFKTGVQFQVRTAATKEALATSPWTGPAGPGSHYVKSGEPLQQATGRWIQYKATLVSPNDINSPVLRGVSISYR